MIKIKYFGALVARTRRRGEKIYFSGLRLSQLLTELERKYELNQFPFSVAVNQKIIDKFSNQILKSNDTVALLPPFIGA
ncbi:molybdopterin converting factor small subunit [Flavobacterium sp. 1]|uniref:MoaD/ThiS family protein n=1 Tax=Flavobacterium sp. 1 TaxID=2035200 RepID=UPI000C24AE30|nr:MoaD/ThiS family protein [Flavobacterium sp. 1]PJJ08694.1 molybdopterin converting factor small subunit [Flavobacterium sp. 1]